MHIFLLYINFFPDLEVSSSSDEDNITVVIAFSGKQYGNKTLSTVFMELSSRLKRKAISIEGNNDVMLQDRQEIHLDKKFDFQEILSKWKEFEINNAQPKNSVDSKTHEDKCDLLADREKWVRNEEKIYETLNLADTSINTDDLSEILSLDSCDDDSFISDPVTTNVDMTCEVESKDSPAKITNKRINYSKIASFEDGEQPHFTELLFNRSHSNKPRRLSVIYENVIESTYERENQLSVKTPPLISYVQEINAQDERIKQIQKAILVCKLNKGRERVEAEKVLLVESKYSFIVNYNAFD